MRRARDSSGQEGPIISGKTAAPPRILVFGVGNPGRCDDGLGAQAVERLAGAGLPGVTYNANYQLNVEDALACSRNDIVIFIDAARGLRRPFALRRIAGDGRAPAMTHALGPQAVLAICAELYGRAPDSYVLAIRGREWGLGEGLSPEAAKNLAAAVDYLKEFLTKKKPARKRVR